MMIMMIMVVVVGGRRDVMFVVCSSPHRYGVHWFSWGDAASWGVVLAVQYRLWGVASCCAIATSTS